MNEQFKLYKTDDFAVIPIEPKIFRTFALISTEEKGRTFLVKAFLDAVIPKINTRLKAVAGRPPQS